MLMKGASAPYQICSSQFSVLLQGSKESIKSWTGQQTAFCFLNQLHGGTRIASSFTNLKISYDGTVPLRPHRRSGAGLPNLKSKHHFSLSRSRINIETIFSNHKFSSVISFALVSHLLSFSVKSNISSITTEYHALLALLPSSQRLSAPCFTVRSYNCLFYCSLEMFFARYMDISKWSIVYNVSTKIIDGGLSVFNTLIRGCEAF